VIFLNAFLQPENGHADVFLPVSIQTERAGHYTNFQGVVSGFEPCFPKAAAVSDAEVLFRALAAPARVTHEPDLAVTLVFVGYALACCSPSARC